MSLKTVLGLAACAVIAVTAGCSTTGDTVRGQNPPAVSEQQNVPIQQAALQPAPYPNQPYVIENAQGAGGFNSSSRRGWYPTHQHTFDYRAPQGLVYPPANQPAAVVQYPYYTLKGPDDFFLNH